MFEINQFSDLCKKYPNLFNRILIGFELRNVGSNGELLFQNDLGDKLKISVGNEVVMARCEKIDSTCSYEMISLPNNDNDRIYSVETHTLFDDEAKKAKVEETIRNYEKIDDSDEYCVTSIDNRVYIGVDFRYISEACSHFSVRMSDENRNPMNTGNTVSFLNGKNVSDVFRNITGDNSVEVVYNLYNGIITPDMFSILNDISMGYCSEGAFFYKEKSGIKAIEDKYIKANADLNSQNMLRKYIEEELEYSGEVNVNSRDEVLSLLKNYNKNAVQFKDFFTGTYGVDFSDFIHLDSSEQYRILGIDNPSDDSLNKDLFDCLGKIVPFERYSDDQRKCSGYVKKD